MLQGNAGLSFVDNKKVLSFFPFFEKTDLFCTSQKKIETSGFQYVVAFMINFSAPFEVTCFPCGRRVLQP